MLSSEIRKIDSRTVTRNGSTYQQNTANIGSKPDRAHPDQTGRAQYRSGSEKAGAPEDCDQLSRVVSGAEAGKGAQTTTDFRQGPEFPSL
jgi:hypothetical protein